MRDDGNVEMFSTSPGGMNGTASLMGLTFYHFLSIFKLHTYLHTCVHVSICNMGM